VGRVLPMSALEVFVLVMTLLAVRTILSTIRR
jgi:hypothetical protein